MAKVIEEDRWSAQQSLLVWAFWSCSDDSRSTGCQHPTLVAREHHNVFRHS